MQVTFLGHSCFEVVLGHRTLLFDPWLVKRPQDHVRLVPPAVEQGGVGRVDFVFLSHEHFDHCDHFDVENIVRRSMAQVVGPPDALALVEVNPRLKVPVEVGDSFSLGGLQVDVTEATHPQSTYPVGFVVRDSKQSLYFAGDTYDFHGMNEIGADVAFLPIGGMYTMDVFGAITALKRLKAKYVIPMHYDTFEHIRVDLRDFADRVKKNTKTVPVVLEVGESVKL